MFCALVLLAVPLADPGVSVADLDRFPGQSTARTQRQRYQRWRTHLQGQMGHHAVKEPWLRWIAETARQIDYWTLLYEAHETFLLGNEWQLMQLERLRDLVGPELYHRGWTPFVLPETLPGLRDHTPLLREAA